MTDASPPQNVRVLLVEDDPLLLDALRELVDAEPGLQVVGAFEAGQPALGSAVRAEVALVDLGLPDMHGPDLIRQLKDDRPAIDVLAHTVFEDRQVVFDAIVAGASGYLLKGGPPEEVPAAIRELRAGGSPMSPRIAREVVRAFRRQGTVADRYSLSGRERQVLALLEQGLTYKEVAAELHVSRHTVHTHIKRIYDKLHASSRAEALTKARLRGMI